MEQQTHRFRGKRVLDVQRSIMWLKQGEKKREKNRWSKGQWGWADHVGPYWPWFGHWLLLSSEGGHI